MKADEIRESTNLERSATAVRFFGPRYRRIREVTDWSEIELPRYRREAPNTVDKQGQEMNAPIKDDAFPGKPGREAQSCSRARGHFLAYHESRDG
jgi:hypothetical protein